ncbi:Zinc finger protein BRUTUS-like [Sesamum angolense]|uniref:Zinc finger protein BRUTUS-like n=1 Tax=Sesamum angolense TaxID=2727404 RepID=A0AAE2BR93_9LAMI|nr:Zinc finger protein BRUTUS-like [Sesamum angolense]
MGGGEPEKEEDWPVTWIAGVRLVDAPVLFFVATHKAFRAELAALRRAAADAARNGVCGGEVVVDLRRRLEFLRLVYNYHTAAEDEVFPLVKQKFTSEQQSQLVWQYICSVPVILLEEFLPWMTLYLTSDEKLDVLGCIKLITPKERILQEVVLSWIQKVERYSSDVRNIYGKGCQLLNGLSSSKDMYPPQIQCEEEQQLEKTFPVQIRGIGVPIKDVLIFYSDSLDKIFYPVLRQLSNKNLSSCSPLIDESQIKNLRVLLFCEAQGPDQNSRSFIEMLCQELESLERWFSKNLILLETEVFPSLSESCASEMQLWFFTSLHMMPLGLLRCTITWFSSHLTENQSNSILKNMKLGCPSISKPFISLLQEWVRIGCSGKTSIDKFRQNLEEMFNGRCFYLTKQNRRDTVFCNGLPGLNSTIKMRESVDIPSSSISVGTEERDMSCPSEMNLHIFFSQMFKRMPPLQKNLAESDDAMSLNLESRPMDLIFYIHRALIKDLENLVILSAKLAANVGFLTEFKNRFKLLHNIYQVHSISEDEIAFPALESKGAHQNISHSYCIDHKLEAKHFRRTSIILDEISELNDREGCNKTGLKYYHLCLKLHETCLSMHKVLSDHIYREEVEIFPLFRGCFSTEEEEKIVGHMLGRTRAEFLQEMIPWLMAYLSSGEQHAVMSLWLRITRYTKFDEWLGEWWEGMTRYNTSTVEEGSRSPSLAADPLEVVSMYLMKDDAKIQKVRHDKGTPKEFASGDCNYSGSCAVDESMLHSGSQDGCQSRDLSQYESEVDKKRSNEANDKCRECQKLSHHEHPMGMNQEELEATIRRISRDSNLDCQKKSYIIQNLLMRKAITKMMCMKCLVIQPTGPICTSQSCSGFSMGRYYCKICKLFDDERTTLVLTIPAQSVASLWATCRNFIIFKTKSKNMDQELSFIDVNSNKNGYRKVYFEMLDALLAEEKIPEEYAGQIQVILCNDCEKRGTASFHWLYHKCPYCERFLELQSIVQLSALKLDQ